MEQLPSLLAKLPAHHRSALEWFDARANTVISWPAPLQDGTLLVTRAKGIYKPQWSAYALSVRQVLKSVYPDEEPIVYPDGTWSYRYFQEGTEFEDRDVAFTNRGLLACLKDGVPVGVLRQQSPKPGVKYKVLGVALVRDWNDGYFSLEGFNEQGFVSTGAATERDLARYELLGSGSGFDPSQVNDDREKLLASIVRRRGQMQFRGQLLRAYGSKCAVTECDAPEALEAAHIDGYKGSASNHVQNGLLLRSDIHLLFDLGLITVDPVSWTVLVAPRLSHSAYGSLDGAPVHLPDKLSDRPSAQALAQHKSWAGI